MYKIAFRNLMDQIRIMLILKNNLLNIKNLNKSNLIMIRKRMKILKNFINLANKYKKIKRIQFKIYIITKKN
jgi:hypothetical protein